MDSLSKKTFTTTRGYTYTYYLHGSSSSFQPALVLLHGWPDNAHLWAEIVPGLTDLGFPIVVPDLLGYDGTSKPTDFQAYNSKGMSDDVYELLDSEGFDKIIPVGHDWGSFMASRVYIWRPERCVGLITLNVAYRPPNNDTPYDLDQVLDMTEKIFGMPLFAYWDVFAADDGPSLLLNNVETLFHIINSNDPSGMAQSFCVRGAMRKMLQESSPKSHPLKPYAEKPGFKDAFLERMRRDGFEGPQCWYKAMARNVQFETEKAIPKENLHIKNPLLYIGGTQDAVCRPELLAKELVSDLESHMVESNHWITYEKPVEVGEIIAAWLKKNYQQGQANRL